VANTVTHGAGVIASALASSVLIVMAARGGDVWKIVSVAVFGTTLLVLYLASTLYHAADGPRARARLKIFDHSAIYLLIAGTYTPFTLGVMRGAWGWSLFGVVWGLAVAGVVFKLFFTGRFRLLSTFLYVGLGWIALIAAGPLMRSLSPAALSWLVAGGVAYTAGTPFYQAGRFRHAHAVWHLFVLAGSICHAVAIGFLL
jgi:hemolysin III